MSPGPFIKYVVRPDLLNSLTKIEPSSSAQVKRDCTEPNGLKKSVDFPGFRVDIDVEVAWGCWETWNSLNVGSQGIPAQISKNSKKSS